MLELEIMIKKLTNRKMKKQVDQIHSVERCEVNYSIFVNNITKEGFCDKDALELYFQSTKHSGGGVVTCVNILGPNKAKVTFMDPSGLKTFIFYPNV